MAKNPAQYDELKTIAEGVVSGDIENPMTENPGATYFSHSRCEAEDTYYEQKIDVDGSNPDAENYGGYVAADNPEGWRVYYYGPVAGAESNYVPDPQICPQ